MRAAEVFRNKDYYGTQVRNPEDSPVRQGYDIAKHMVPTPLFARSIAAERQTSDSNALTQGASILGFVKAPAWVGQSSLDSYLRDNSPKIDRATTKESSEKGRTVAQLANEYQKAQTAKQDPAPVINRLRQMVADKKLGEADIDKFIKQVEEPPLVRRFKGVPFEAALHGFVDKASPEEQKQLGPILIDRILNFAEKHPDEFEKQREYFDKAKAIIQKLGVTATPEGYAEGGTVADSQEEAPYITPVDAMIAKGRELAQGHPISDMEAHAIAKQWHDQETMRLKQLAGNP